MSRSASSSRTAVVAGTLAGLLAAGLGAYYLHLRPAEAPSRPAGHGPAAAPVPRGKEQAMANLMALPELRAWSARLEQRSGGKVHGALIEYDPLPRALNGKRYWQFSFVENGADAAERWESFLVEVDGNAILVDDAASGELLSLERWRAETQPMRRGAD